MKIFKKLYQRYKDMGSLPWIVCIVLLSVIAYYTVPVIGLIQAGGDERLLGVCLQPAGLGGALCKYLAAGLSEPVEP